MDVSVHITTALRLRRGKSSSCGQAVFGEKCRFLSRSHVASLNGFPSTPAASAWRLGSCVEQTSAKGYFARISFSRRTASPLPSRLHLQLKSGTRSSPSQSRNCCFEKLRRIMPNKMSAGPNSDQPTAEQTDAGQVLRSAVLARRTSSPASKPTPPVRMVANPIAATSAWRRPRTIGHHRPKSSRCAQFRFPASW